MSNRLELHWKFWPPDFFEERTELTCAGFTFVIDDGMVRTVTLFDEDPRTRLRELCNELHQILDAAFVAAQIFAQDPYELHCYEPIVITSEGVRHVYVNALPLQLTTAFSDIDVRNGAVDTRRERVAARNYLVTRAVAPMGDPTANAILRSYAASVRNPAYELAHLYDIRDALSTRFGGERLTHDALGTSATQWSTLGRLADGEPLLQGRHRGWHVGTLRPATAPELLEARAIARDMIERYMTYLERP